jgi:hypothetical protein
MIGTTVEMEALNWRGNHKLRASRASRADARTAIGEARPQRTAKGTNPN